MTWKVDQTKILTRDEYARALLDLRRRADRSEATQVALMVFRLACGCGLRASEIAGLNIQDVHVGISRPWIQVRAEIAKGHKGRRVPAWWDADTLDDLTWWHDLRTVEHNAGQGQPFVCSLRNGSRGNRLNRHQVRKLFINACKGLGKARCSTLTVHDGRHTFVSHALASGRTPAEVMEAAGHASLGTTSIYTHVAVEDDGTPGNMFARQEHSK